MRVLREDLEDFRLSAVAVERKSSAEVRRDERSLLSISKYFGHEIELCKVRTSHSRDDFWVLT